MIHIRGLDHIVLRTRKLDAMLEFYQQHLNLSLERCEADAGLYQLRAGTSLIDIVPVDSPLGRAGGDPPDHLRHNVDHFCLQVAGFEGDALLAYCAEHGIEHSSVERRYGAEGFGLSLYITDPEGNIIELKGPAEPGTRMDVRP